MSALSTSTRTETLWWCPSLNSSLRETLLILLRKASTRTSSLSWLKVETYSGMILTRIERTSRLTLSEMEALTIDHVKNFSTRLRRCKSTVRRLAWTQAYQGKQARHRQRNSSSMRSRKHSNSRWKARRGRWVRMVSLHRRRLEGRVSHSLSIHLISLRSLSLILWISK